eukprot:363475-Chlamydomonas_euryale.AAC.2
MQPRSPPCVQCGSVRPMQLHNGPCRRHQANVTQLDLYQLDSAYVQLSNTILNTEIHAVWIQLWLLYVYFATSTYVRMYSTYVLYILGLIAVLCNPAAAPLASLQLPLPYSFPAAPRRPTPASLPRPLCRRLPCCGPTFRHAPGSLGASPRNCTVAPCMQHDLSWLHP